MVKFKKMQFSTVLKPYMPKSLLGRAILIIVMPLILLQLVTAVIFFENHWGKVGRRLALAVAGDIAMTVEYMHNHPDTAAQQRFFKQAHNNLRLEFSFNPDGVIEPSRAGTGLVESMLIQALDELLRKPYRIDTLARENFVIIDVQLGKGVLRVGVPNKRFFSTTTYVFVMWMVGTSLLLFGVATIFMKNQVRPISRLAVAADNFGTGRDTPGFKPEGAAEVRRAASAFIAMRDRIQRQIQQRTDMLAGVSHDLRTPLTRMKLQLEMMGDGSAIVDIKGDVADMEHMLEGYLAFARGEGGEKPASTNISTLLNDIGTKARRKGAAIDVHAEGDLVATVRPQALTRALTNIVENAGRYAQNIAVRAGRRDSAVEIVIDDDGPGIAPDRRSDVFKPFFRVEGSRNPETGGVGLGMTIARDVVRAHGGDIALEDAPGGGLRVRISVPV